MSIVNSSETYGSVARVFHWLTALLILTAMPLGVIAHNLPTGSDAEIARAVFVFSIHKTVGIAAFFVAILRILWALTQEKPRLLHPDRKLESFAAEVVHWLLYVSLVLVPLSGWLHHAATEGFAEIWWPFGQDLPFVPNDPHVAEFFGAWHFVFTKVLLVSVLLHIAGALKHHVIDKDATLRRMLSGARADVTPPAHAAERGPFLAALGIWAAAIALASMLGSGERAEAPALAAMPSEWSVEEGTLAITVLQLGSEVGGTFADWTAAINFSETPDAEGRHGDVLVQVSIPTLTLGSVTDQALGAEYLDGAGHPMAEYKALIVAAEGGGFLATGDLTLRGQTAPLDLPFDLAIEGDRAVMSGETTVDRRDFGIAVGSGNESSIGPEVKVEVTLVATR